MKTRGLAIMVAFLLAIGATAAVYMYVQGVRNDATGGVTDMATVIVSKQDIPARSSLDNLISGGAFTTLQIPLNAVVQGAITDVSQLNGKSTAFPILQGEQITTARLQGSSTQVEGGVLGIPQGQKALTLPMELTRAVGGVIQAGDHITLYATFDDVSIISSRATLNQLLGGKQAETKKRDIGSFTVTVVADVQVLKVANSLADQNGGQSMVTLALSPEDAQKVVFSQENGKVWFALLPPGESGTTVPALNVVQVLR
jgi:pilus assembly protein CpaB